MNTRKSIIVTRTYKPVADDCARALVFLLKTCVSKEAAHPAAPDDGKERSKHAPATQKYNG